ncbi:MAG TPA: YbhB/YbcL family Raf kinase inhibitor-like protein [Gemmataceae bacterium]|nr:YbhB/YbcL family Raf kinase inhibitor-like protein [Gemmataceae bacterium]
MSRTPLLGFLALPFLAGCNRNDADSAALDVGAAIKLTSSAFADGQPIPKQFARSGDNQSPPLAWTDAPKDAKSFALICDDPDAPMGTFTHWLIWNLPGDAHDLPAAQPTTPTQPNGARQGQNGFPGVGYAGPDPPSGTHHYRFKIYALDIMLDLPAGSTTKQDLEKAMKGHVLGHGLLTGAYQK